MARSLGIAAAALIALAAVSGCDRRGIFVEESRISTESIEQSEEAVRERANQQG